MPSSLSDAIKRADDAKTKKYLRNIKSFYAVKTIKVKWLKEIKEEIRLERLLEANDLERKQEIHMEIKSTAETDKSVDKYEQQGLEDADTKQTLKCSHQQI